MKNILQKGKDLAVSKLIKTLINNKLKKFGEVLILKLNSKEKTIELKIALRGELEPLLATIKDYEIIEIEEDYFLVLTNIETSREWINLVADEYLKDRKIKIPNEHIKKIKAII